jgi:D-alanyl-D-alanine carboxypeptidase/D-alanyl-D-alanine-endopeptidase (penicillin-binding protein 4)
MKRTIYSLVAFIMVTLCLPTHSVAQFTNPNDVDTTPGSTSSVDQTRQFNTEYRSNLIRSIMPLLNDPVFENAVWGVQVIDLNTGAPLFSRNAQKSMMPASNTKLYTTSAGLELLGADFTYETRLWAIGDIQDGALKGNLIIEGSGDPTISGRFTDDDRTLIFRRWASDLKSKGITRIDGNIIGDDTIFDDISLGRSWSWDYTTYWYAAEMGAISFNENCIDMIIVGTSEGQPAKITWEPFETSYVQVINETITTAAGSTPRASYDRPWGTNTIYVRNYVPAGDTIRYSLSITNPTLFFAHVLRETFIKEGIEVNGELFDRSGLNLVEDYKNRGQIVASYTSPSLGEIVYILNKRSQNMFAENLLKTVGAHHKMRIEEIDQTAGLEASARDGFRASWPVFGAAGIDTTRLQLADGSGMSRVNLVSPDMTTRLLRYMWHHGNKAVRDAFIHSLPLGGEPIGTLRTMFRSGPASASVAAKTGTIGYARALSGYVTAADGTPLAFSIMVNHHTAGNVPANRVIESLVNKLAEFKYD